MQASRHVVRDSSLRGRVREPGRCSGAGAGESLEKVSDDGLFIVGDLQPEACRQRTLARTKFWSDSELAIPGDKAESLVRLSIPINDRVGPAVTHVIEHVDNDLKALVPDCRP
jgi:hypothetical protein